jgi:hypothetical protein
MVIEELEELDAGQALLAFGDLRAAREAAERDIFVLLAHVADLYHLHSRGGDLAAQRRLPGTEQPIRLGGPGTPLVWEFALAEVAAELHLSTGAARRQMADALDVRHRLPRLWTAVTTDQVPAWRAGKVAQATRALSVEQAAVVDTELDGLCGDQISYARFDTLLQAAVIKADPEAAAAREQAAARQRFAKVGQSNEHGTKTLYVKSGAAEIARIDATIAYLAQTLKQLGDPDDEDRRRTKAILILANPTQAVALLQTAATHHQANDPGTGSAAADGTGAGGTGAGGTGAGGMGSSSNTVAREDAGAGEDQGSTSGSCDSTTGSNRDRTGDRGESHPTQAPGRAAGTGGPPYSPWQDPLPDPEDEHAPPPPPDPAEEPAADPPGSQGTSAPAADTVDTVDTGDTGDPLAGYYRPFHPDQTPPCGCRGGTWLPDAADLLPSVTLYLHTHAATHGPDGTGHGAA